MLRVTLRGLQGHVLRLLLTAAAVMLGVSFVTGTFVLRDSIDGALHGLIAGASAGQDVSVRGVEVETDDVSDGLRPGVPLGLVETVAAVDGVARVSPDLAGTGVIAGSDGRPVRNSGAPGLAFAFAVDDPAFTLVDGRGPGAPDEVAVESATLAKSGLAVGDTTRAVIGGRTGSVTITGEVSFGTLFGATAVLVDDDTARELFAPDGTVTSLTVTAKDGVDQQQLQVAVSAVLPASAEAVTGEAVQAESEDAVQEGLGFFTTFLLVFAAVALFVGGFIIINTFAMLVGQRARELALLRALGASRGQVLRAVLGEAVIVGIVGSLLGMGLGVLVAWGALAGIRGLLDVDLGNDLPVSASTLGISMLVGVAVTVVAAVLPARRAARTAPVAAMRGDQPGRAGSVRRRGLIGAAMLVCGAVGLLLTVTRDEVAWAGAGGAAFVATLGVLVIAPWAATPVVRAVCAPFVAAVGVVGRLARQNTLRVPRRTAATASALMVGLALVAGISVLADSVRASVTEGVSEELTADFALSGGLSPVPATLAPIVRDLDGVDAVAAISQVPIRIDGFSSAATAATAADVADTFDVDMAAGALADLAGNGVMVDESTAAEQGWSVGDEVSATLGVLTGEELVITGIYEDNQGFSLHVLVDRALYEQAVPAAQRSDQQVFVRAETSADLAALRTALETAVAPYLVVEVQNAEQFADAQGSSIDLVVNLLYVLLLFSVVIAVLGIINTLALSVLERTREIGLLRAVGLGRRQLGAMITIEAVATAVFGAVLGTVLGVGLGVALRYGLRAEGLTDLGIPWSLIVMMLGASVLVGIIAAVAPAVRASRLHVLQAITRA
ncbi:MAG: transporter permease [Nocardioides sp.]|nr:transporter permease [Nocardioides sp.]